MFGTEARRNFTRATFSKDMNRLGARHRHRRQMPFREASTLWAVLWPALACFGLLWPAMKSLDEASVLLL